LIASTDFWRGKTVLVTGGDGFLGGHLTDALRARGVAPDRLRLPAFPETDLRRREDCVQVVLGAQVVIHLAAKVGGIGLNKERPAELFYENAIMGLELMEAARLAGVEKFITIGTTCEYPKVTPVPFRETALWDGYPDEITGPYGLAKKMLLVQAQTYRAQYGFNSIHLIPTNLYGPRDHFDEVHGHVIPSLIRRFVEAAESNAPEVTVWGTGRATREFIYAEDAALGIAQAAEAYDEPEPVNLGSGVETPIRELVERVAALAGFSGAIRWDASKPDGQPRRSLDVSRARERFGFVARTPLDEGLRRTVDWYREHRS
jgi:GDP-L-fucose synthase